MGNLIEERVLQARADRNKFVVSQMSSGWLAIGDVQPLLGYCVFLADPLVRSINDLAEDARISYSLDVLRASDAILAATGAQRTNYETLCNSEPLLHTHLIPRYGSAPDDKRKMPAFMMYSWQDAPKYDPKTHGSLKDDIARYLI